MKSYVLDHVFKFHRQIVQSNKNDKTKLKDYIYDLENTWSINTEILKTMLNETYTGENKKQLCSIIERIKENVSKKKSLIENKMKIRGKLLMDKQIMEEYKRRNDENMAYYSEQTEEFKENLDKKDSFIKQFIKKFNEVEIYIQREAASLRIKWGHLASFEIVEFINRNESMQRRRLQINEEINIIGEDINAILRENVELKKRDEYIDISDEDEDQNSKYVTLINNYESKIKYFERNNESLKNIVNNLTRKFDNTNTMSFFRSNKPLINHQRNYSLAVLENKRINSKAEFFLSDLNLISEKIDGHERNQNKIIEDVDDMNEEIFYQNGVDDNQIGEEEDGNLKSCLLNLENKKSSDNNHDHSIFNQVCNYKNTQENTFNRDQWDISCIENL